MTRLRYILLLVLLLPFPLLAQTGSLTGVALDNVGNTVAGATITACTLGSPGIPCAPVTASTTSNGQGAFSMVVPVGTYTVTVFRLGVVATSSTVVVAPSNITVANTVTYTGNVTIGPGNLTVSGTQTVGKWNGNCIVDGVANLTLAAAVTCAGSSGVIEIASLVVPALTASVTIPAGVTLRFDGPGGITTTGFTLTINGPIVAPDQQIFFGTGTVVLNPATVTFPIYATWFGGLAAAVNVISAGGASCPSTVLMCGGIINETHTETFATNPMAGASGNAPVAVSFGQGQWNTNVQIDVPHESKMRGLGTWNGKGGTAIVANPGTFPSYAITATTETGNAATYSVANTTGIAVNSMACASGVTVNGYNQCFVVTSLVANTSVTGTIKAGSLANSSGGTLSAAVVRIGRDTQTHNAYVENMTVSCANIAGCAGVASTDANEYSGVRDSAIINFPAFGIDVESSAGGSAQGFLFTGIEIQPGNSGLSTTQGFRFVGNGGGCFNELSKINVVSNVAQPIGQGFFWANCTGGYAYDLHVEQATSGLIFGDPTLGQVTGIVVVRPNMTGNITGVGITCASGGTACASYSIINANTTAATNISDPVNGITITDSYATLIVGAGGVGARDIYSTSTASGHTLVGTTILTGGAAFKGGWGVTGNSTFMFNSAPTIAAAGCGGGAASITANHGTGAFKIGVGTTPGSACTFTMPAATVGWNVHCDDITTQSTSVFVQKQTGAESTTSVTITNFNDVAVATAFVAGDVLKCTAFPDN